MFSDPTCSACSTPCIVGLQVVTRNPWTGRHDLHRYCRACAVRLGELDFSPEDKPATKPAAVTRPKHQPFALRLEERK